MDCKGQSRWLWLVALSVSLGLYGCASGRWCESPVHCRRERCRNPVPAAVTQAPVHAEVPPLENTAEPSSEFDDWVVEQTSAEMIAGIGEQPAEEIPASESGEGDPLPGAVSPAADSVPIDLGTALAMTAGRNPQVQFAVERARESMSRLDAANVLWLPSIHAGASYNKHEGSIQETNGNVLDASRSAAFSGLGAKAAGAGSPAVPGVSANFHVADAIFQPRIANRLTAASRYAADATTNDTLLEVAIAYLGLLGAAQQVAIAEETLRNSQQLADLTDSYARVGQGLQADADRAAAELALRKNNVERAIEQMRVAQVRLAQLLSEDVTVPLVPAESVVCPIELVPLDTPLEELIATGLTNRPELAESKMVVSAAVQQLRRERFAPLIPNLSLGVSQGGFGGGMGGEIDNYRDRLDVDVAAFWELRNLGAGERAARRGAQSRVRQANWQQVAAVDLVSAELTAAHAQVHARQQQIDTAQSGVRRALDSYRHNRERIREAEGLPIEVLQAIQALDQARREYLRTVIDYNEAQFRLHRALGWPAKS